MLLVLAPAGREAAVIQTTLQSAGLESEIGDNSRLVEAIRNNRCGLAIITDDYVGSAKFGLLKQAISAQAPWSDCPLVLLARERYPREANAAALIECANVTVLERPLRAAELVNAVRRGLRSRERQHRAATYMHEREVAQALVSNLLATLESRVEDRTRELRQALAIGSATHSLLVESEELHRITIELSNQTVWTATNRGALVSITSRWAEQTGNANADIMGQQWHRFVHPNDRRRLLLEQRGARTQDRAIDSLYRVRDAHKDYRWWRVRATPCRDDHGEVLRFYGTLEDVDDRFQVEARVNTLQNELAHVSRVSAMGTLASTLAHELNQPLAGIVNYVRGVRHLIADTHGDGAEPIIQALAQADRSAVRAAEIVRRLRELVTRGKVRMLRTDLVSLIEESFGLALIDTKALGISHEFVHDGAVTWVDVDRIQMQQVLINLMRNSVEALTGMQQGRILVSVQTQGHEIVIVVSDNGPGLPSAIAARLFESFNSSKADGLGIGLSISRSIVEAHGGKLLYEPALDGGASFSITLPRAAGKAAGSANSYREPTNVASQIRSLAE